MIGAGAATTTFMATHSFLPLSRRRFFGLKPRAMRRFGTGVAVLSLIAVPTLTKAQAGDLCRGVRECGSTGVREEGVREYGREEGTPDATLGARVSVGVAVGTLVGHVPQVSGQATGSWAGKFVVLFVEL